MSVMEGIPLYGHQLNTDAIFGGSFSVYVRINGVRPDLSPA